MNSGKSNSLALVLVALFVISAGVFVVLGDSSTQTPNEAEPEPEVIETPVIEAAGQLINTQEPTRVDIERNTDISNSEIDNLFADAIGGAVSGKVVNENGSPVSGAVISLNQRYNPGELMRGYSSGERFQITSDRNGEFIFTGLAAGINMNMWVKHQDFAPKQAAPFAALENETQTLPPVVLRRGYQLVGTVTDRGGNPLEAVVEMRMQPSDAFRQGSKEEIRDEDVKAGRIVKVTADANGKFAFDKLAEGIWILRASYDGFASAEIRPVMLLQGKDVGEQKVVLPDELTISGIVVDVNEMPVADAVVSVARTSPRPTFTGSAKTNGQGEFNVRGLQEGSYGLSVQASGYTNGRSGRVDAGSTGLRIVMQQKASVNGRVQGMSGEAIKDFKIEILRTRRGNQQYGLTGQHFAFNDTDGTFVIEDLNPGAYILLGRADGYAPTYSSGFTVGRTQVDGIDILLKPGGIISGSVADGEGNPVAGMVISVHGEDYSLDSRDTLFGSAMSDPNNMPQLKTRTNSKGEFILKNVFEGDLNLVLDHSDFLTELVAARSIAGTTNNIGKLIVYRGGTVQGVAHDKDGTPLAGGTVTMTTRSQSFFHKTVTIDAKGRYRISGLAAGSYDIIAAAAANDAVFLFPSEADKQSVYVNTGEVLELDLQTSE